MIIRINGVVLEEKPFDFIDIQPYLPKNNKEMKKFRKLSTWLWSVSGAMLINNPVLAAGNSSSMWIKMQPLWSTFQQIAMVVGGIALFVGILTFIFKRSLGKSIITTSLIVVAGCFLVPSAIMLMGIIGQMMNDVLVDVFSGMNMQNSVKVGQ